MESAEIRYAGFWVRVGAAIIDSIIVVIITLPPLIAIYGSAYFAPQGPIVHGFMDFLISWVLPTVAVILFWIFRQATPGKMALKLRIVDAKTGREPSTAQCIGRYFGYFVSLFPLGLGIIWVGVDKRKQGWHDKLAGTVVIRSEQEEPVRFEHA